MGGIGGGILAMVLADPKAGRSGSVLARVCGAMRKAAVAKWKHIKAELHARADVKPREQRIA